jgi:hypothetical protein
METRNNRWGWPWWALACVVLACGVFLGKRYIPWVRVGPRVGTAWNPEYVREAEFPEMPGLKWTADLDHALDRAQREHKLVLVEVASLADTNGEVVHHKVFPRREVTAELKPYILVMLYTDVISARLYRTPPSNTMREQEGQVNWDWIGQTFQTAQTPYYAILKPKRPGRFRTVAVYDVYPHLDWQKFAAWLNEYAPLRD